MEPIERAAKRAAGNWKRFECFIWHEVPKLKDPDASTIVYTHHRDSGPLERANAEVIRGLLRPFMEGPDADVWAEIHDHWAVGWIEGYRIRVFRDGRITNAFRAWYDIACRLENYPVLDEHVYSQYEYEETLGAILSRQTELESDFDLPANWEGEAYDWLLRNAPEEIESGRSPSIEALRNAAEALGYPRTEATI